MKIKITHPIPDKPDLKVGHAYDLPPKDAKPILDADWGFQVVEKKVRDDRKD